VASARAVPFYCPYCGEEDIVPDLPAGASGEGHGHWSCRACRRAFRLSLTALATARTEPTTAPAPAAAADTPASTPATTTRHP
jgi:transposase-like protein